MDDDEAGTLPAGTHHRGRFVHAGCDRCGWWGPARRALHSAQVDLVEHAAAHAVEQHVEQHGEHRRRGEPAGRTDRSVVRTDAGAASGPVSG